jgi:hypothetical protein
MPRLSSSLNRADQLVYSLHAPGHLREAFRVYLEQDEDLALKGFWDRAGKQAWWDAKSPPERLRCLIGRLWNCTDVLPSDLRSTMLQRLDMPPRFGIWTYAAAVQALARQQRTQVARVRGLLDF